ncbi:MAG TPA: hypothetical protein VL088_14530 [Pedobacter sp.]|nr:hypothetical protein [Pedobacter sp.]
MKITFNILIILLLLVLFSKPTFAQKNPDTLVIGTKNGQIILVSDSLLKFAPMQTEELIRKALYKIIDSLPKGKSFKAKSKINSDSSYTKIIKKKMFRVTGEFGLGLIRDKISPAVAIGLEFAPQKQDYYRKKKGMYSFINLSAYATSTFREEENNYRTYQNTFLEFTIGNKMNTEDGYRSLTELSSGVGYLIQREGNYFERNTFKVFVNFGLPKTFIIIRPECYFIKKNTFLGLTIKLINISNYF